MGRHQHANAVNAFERLRDGQPGSSRMRGDETDRPDARCIRHKTRRPVFWLGTFRQPCLPTGYAGSGFQ